MTHSGELGKYSFHFNAINSSYISFEKAARDLKLRKASFQDIFSETVLFVDQSDATNQITIFIHYRL